MMGIGDLVTWKDDDESVKLPWWYHNWKDVGVVVDLFDVDTVMVQWCSGSKFPVWLTEIEVLSKSSCYKIH